ncbi:MAG: RNA ligase [Candidatus Raymondbacteria bacterium RifOxyA12_full_50_37]|uniref:RNA ligase n=1 Tax=Candidatus Raymondbacteria bacterium RIFOXYD12_FULL_49_13 TaxID=1817890 RepID=A0A1F7F2G7_UNCRA|nr:MAG: RNA ligase [Candidatus Raymondbacteria bacterium RifOxyA12_full_50_37]OGJ87805.1 MAG: RNA ligase [Candidatus Raymondbacteria bacterium RifOxyB12_full_50_8]OGJ88659.1 MAG: RNA ligase [Candidatus Raymondbacteria bacterium RIFOXYA2_FULL_49_16]OGK00831.1 MAG: RNA ligase [Candidatus Raymondbacteria bacterium RIFOXYD12_FULL_49_13]OGP41696.1 MAG: RNA ligase [Candidatus Raymondbacteria bacterium RIFOXYB2_FULL_49_35]
MRKLATIRLIEEVLPIEGADAIEKVRIGGWWVVARKNEFKPGDKCVYFEIDSLLPPLPQYAFLEKAGKKKTLFEGRDYEGYRIKTIKLRGQISQGLALPVASFPGIPDELGADVSEKIGVVKYEAPVPVDLSGEVKGAIPGFIPKTDEERIQNSLELLEKCRGQRFYVTEKVDGTSTTFFKYDGQFGVCSRNLEILENESNVFWNMARSHKLPENLPDGYAVQGEAVGQKIQSNPLKINGQKCLVFYVVDLKKQEYLPLPEMKAFVEKLGMEMVPVFNDNFILDQSYDQLLKIADMKSVYNPNVNAEGLVFRLYDSRIKVTFKVISNQYLLKQE